jgi:hypothetical protein
MKSARLAGAVSRAAWLAAIAIAASGCWDIPELADAGATDTDTDTDTG